VTSQTLVVRKVSITKSETIRLDARAGRQLSVALTGAEAQNLDLTASACMYNAPGSSDQASQAAWGGNGVAVYVVPARSHAAPTPPGTGTGRTSR
jgi:hypothetical protein